MSESSNSSPKQANAALRQARILRVAQWLADGLTRAEINERGEQAWGIKSAMMGRYSRWAKELLANQVEKSSDALGAWFVSEHLELYNLALNGDKKRKLTPDPRLALDVLKDLQRLVGAYAPERQEISSIGAYAQMSIEERAETFRSILAGAAERHKVDIELPPPNEPS